MVLVNGHLLDQVLRRSGILSENSPQGAWDNIADQMLLEFAESGHPIFRATTPLSRSILKSKGRGKQSIHFAADELTIETIFRITIRAKSITCSLFCSEQLISDYSYCRGGGAEFIFPITVTGGVAARNYFPIPVTAAVAVRGTTVSNDNIR